MNKIRNSLIIGVVLLSLIGIAYAATSSITSVINLSKPIVNTTDLNQTISVTYSSPMNTSINPIVTIYGLHSSPYNVTGGTWDSNGLTYTVTKSLNNDNEYALATIAVSGAKDASGTVAIPNAITFWVDTIKPTSTITELSPSITTSNLNQTIMIIYNKQMNTSINPVVTITGLHSSYNLTNGTWSLGGTIYTVGTTINNDNESATATVNVSGGIDTHGNLQTPSTSTFLVNTTGSTTNSSSPTSTINLSVPNVTTNLHQIITVTYDKQMNTSINPTITITGLPSSYSPANGTWNSNGTTYTVSQILNDQNFSGTATVNVSGAQDLNGDVQVPSSKTFTVNLTGTGNGSGNQIGENENENEIEDSGNEIGESEYHGGVHDSNSMIVGTEDNQSNDSRTNISGENENDFSNQNYIGSQDQNSWNSHYNREGEDH